MKLNQLFFGSLIPLCIVACGGGSEPAGQEGEALSGDTAPVTCSGILPPLCEKCSDGTDACEHWEVVNGVCEAVICPDGGTATPPPQCTGILPPLCEKCSDGTDACAHWEVVNGVCEVEICPGGGSQPPPSPTAAPTATPLTPPSGS